MLYEGEGRLMGGVKVRAGTLKLHSGARIPGMKESDLETEHSMGAEKEQMQEASAASGLPSAASCLSSAGLLSQHQAVTISGLCLRHCFSHS